MLKELVKQYKEVDNIFILEDVPRDITKKYIKKAKCGILSSRYEVYPIGAIVCEGKKYRFKK